MRTIYLIFVGLYLAGLLIRDGYELLKKAGRVDARDTRIVAGVFVCMCVMWVSWFGMGFSDPARLPVPDALQWIGLGAVVVGFGLVLGGMGQLRGVENIDHLVTRGLYSRIRHPMYVGFILLILGWGVRQGALVSLAIGFLGLASIVWWRRLEEGELESRYGGGYAEYRATTWF